MKAGTIKALPSAASVQRAVGPISGQASREVQSNKSAEFAGWPLSWWTQATTDVLRNWGRFSVFTARSAARSRPAIHDDYDACGVGARRTRRGRSADQRRPRCFMPSWAGSRPAFRRPASASRTRTGRSISRRRPANGSCCWRRPCARRFVWRPMRRTPAATPLVRAASNHCRRITASVPRRGSAGLSTWSTRHFSESTMVAQCDDRHRRCVGPP